MEQNYQNSQIMNVIPDSVKREMSLEQAPVVQQPVVAAREINGVSEQPEEFISETFAALSSGQQKLEAVEVAQQPAKAPAKVLNLLDRIQIDIDTIEIVEKSALRQINDMEEVFNKKATYQIVAVQSGFSAEMSALSMRDTNAITNSNVDLYTHKKNLYQAVHAHIEKTSVGKLGFTDWLKITSYHDLETFLYGVYCQTFPEKNEFDITCGSCGKKTNVIVNNETLVETLHEGLIMAKIDEIVRSSKSPADLVGRSLVHTTIKTVLPESKILIDIHTPSLWDHLEMVRTLDPKVIQDHTQTIGLMLFINHLYMLDVEGTLATGRAKYYEIKDKNQVLDILSRLSIKDGAHVEKTINDRIEKYAITYSVKNGKCTHCGDSLGDLPVDMETALFTQINKGRQA